MNGWILDGFTKTWILEGFTKTVLANNLGLRYNIRAYVLSMVGRMLSVRYSPPKVILVMSNNLQSKPVGTAETDLSGKSQ